MDILQKTNVARTNIPQQTGGFNVPIAPLDIVKIKSEKVKETISRKMPKIVEIEGEIPININLDEPLKLVSPNFKVPGQSEYIEFNLSPRLTDWQDPYWSYRESIENYSPEFLKQYKKEKESPGFLEQKQVSESFKDYNNFMKVYKNMAKFMNDWKGDNPNKLSLSGLRKSVTTFINDYVETSEDVNNILKLQHYMKQKSNKNNYDIAFIEGVELYKPYKLSEIPAQTITQVTPQLKTTQQMPEITGGFFKPIVPTQITSTFEPKDPTAEFSSTTDISPIIKSMYARGLARDIGKTKEKGFYGEKSYTERAKAIQKQIALNEEAIKQYLNNQPSNEPVMVLDPFKVIQSIPPELRTETKGEGQDEYIRKNKLTISSYPMIKNFIKEELVLNNKPSPTLVDIKHLVKEWIDYWMGDLNKKQIQNWKNLVVYLKNKSDKDSIDEVFEKLSDFYTTKEF